MSKAAAVQATPAERAERLAKVRELMAAAGLDAYVARGTDRYLNEYVPIGESQRAWLSGFTGSIADVLVTRQRAYLFVDGRYYLQADQETLPDLYQVVRVPLGGVNEQSMYALLRELAPQGIKTLGYEPERWSTAELGAMQKALDGTSVALQAVQPSLVERVRGPVPSKLGALKVVPLDITGSSTDEKLGRVRAAMQAAKLDALVLQALDDIAYLTNMRGDEIAFQSTFKAVCVVTPSQCTVALPNVNGRGELAVPVALRVVDEAGWVQTLHADLHGKRVGYDDGSVTVATLHALEAAGAQAVVFASPIKPIKAVKNEAELRHMIAAFQRADNAFWATQRWLHRQIDSGATITELDLAHAMAKQFKRSGGTGLSFETIAAQGANGAIVHYSDPDGVKPIAPGTMVLLDAGSFYEGGYSTDLTRTFIAGKKTVTPTERQRWLFTTLLKGAIAGMVARFPEGTKGHQLDAQCRHPLWMGAQQYSHGTGHGIGINVHEGPPRVAPVGMAVLEVGQVFSIEPGIYIEGEVGLRIENLCTVVPDAQHKGWLRVVPLTFSPLDKRLIDSKLLDPRERAFVKWFEAMGKQEITVVPQPFEL